jgi:hypothetical protein
VTHQRAQNKMGITYRSRVYECAHFNFAE